MSGIVTRESSNMAASTPKERNIAYASAKKMMKRNGANMQATQHLLQQRLIPKTLEVHSQA